ncbi:CHAT domain-containing protein [Nocardia sp. NPDC052566]|uniref:CHAT domain-containing protein n=1 Tax=Nocardia sp. NPDC052566 TaxID=3364330 RepID=UPI0037C87DE2
MNEQPTVLVRMADAGDIYISWRWLHHDAAPGVSFAREAEVAEALQQLKTALPDPSVPGSLEHALTAGPFATPATEYELGRTLSRTFLHLQLATQLRDLLQQGVRPHIRIQPAPRLAQIPWELLAPSPEFRLLDIADLSALAPAGIVGAPDRKANSWNETRDQPIVAILDPRIPGYRADSPLGSILGRMDPNTPLAQRITEYSAQGRLSPAITAPAEAFRRTDIDRTWLSTALHKGASRLLYVGHVTAAPPESGQSETAELHLPCTADTLGFATPTRTHRPFSAKDLLLGTHTLTPNPLTGQALWPIPSRVALIACESGGDLRFTEALGLVAAMLNNGAELVTATRWPLPTDLAFHRLAAAPPEATPLQDAICAIDTAHEDPAPMHTLNAWQRTHLSAWRTTGSIEHSPLLWAAFATVHD